MISMITSEIVRKTVGWLIERGDSSPSAPTYYAGSEYHWSQDHMDAIRFMRKLDAQRVSYRMRMPNNRICEHMWVDGVAKASELNS